jgi:penicillin-binding protein 2
VERVYNRVLMGADGARRVVVNSVGREIRTLDELPPSEGQRVQLSLNIAMQRAAEDAFRAYGAARRLAGPQHPRIGADTGATIGVR